MIAICQVYLLVGCLYGVCLLDSFAWEVTPSTMIEVSAGWRDEEPFRIGSEDEPLDGEEGEIGWLSCEEDVLSGVIGGPRDQTPPLGGCVRDECLKRGSGDEDDISISLFI